LKGREAKKFHDLNRTNIQLCKSGKAGAALFVVVLAGKRGKVDQPPDEQMNMFGHHNETDDYESISLTHLFENREKAVTGSRPVQKWQSSIAGTSDKVQVMRTVSAMQAAGHDTPHGIGSIDTRPCKKRKDGAPTVS
jgi:hypothetical protein